MTTKQEKQKQKPSSLSCPFSYCDYKFENIDDSFEHLKTEHPLDTLQLFIRMVEDKKEDKTLKEKIEQRVKELEDAQKIDY